MRIAKGFLIGLLALAVPALAQSGTTPADKPASDSKSPGAGMSAASGSGDQGSMDAGAHHHHKKSKKKGHHKDDMSMDGGASGK
jgi:hypothetical protein